LSKYQNAKKYFITAKTDQRLETLLSTHISGCTPAQIVISGGVWLDKKRITDKDQLMKSGQTVIVYVTPDQGKRWVLDPSSIVLETQDILIVTKPPAVTVISDRSNTGYNLTSAVQDYLRASGSSYIVSSPTTRLDFMVQGLVIYPKNKRAEIDLFKSMAAGKIKKKYACAIPHTSPPITHKIIQDKLLFKGKTIIDKEGKDAISEIQFSHTIQPHPEAPLYAIYHLTPITGKRHQLRVHMATYIAPIIGDTLYGSTYPHPDEHIALIAIHYDIPLFGDQITVTLTDWEQRLTKIVAKA